MAQRANTTPLLWIGKNPVYQLCGAEGEGGNGGQGDGGQGNNSNSNQGNANSGQSAGTQGGAAGGQSATGESVSKADFDALMARMQAADRNAQAAQARVQELEGKDKTDLEKAQTALADANKRLEDMTSKSKTMFVNNAFLTVKDAPTWHNNAAALKLLDSSLLTIEDDGTVKGMEAAVAKLKQEHPYLVKTTDDKGAGKGSDDKGGTGSAGRASGSANNGAGAGGTTPDRAALEKRFPAIRGRG